MVLVVLAVRGTLLTRTTRHIGRHDDRHDDRGGACGGACGGPWDGGGPAYDAARSADGRALADAVQQGMGGGLLGVPPCLDPPRRARLAEGLDVRGRGGRVVR